MCSFSLVQTLRRGTVTYDGLAFYMPHLCTTVVLLSMLDMYSFCCT